jgi:hypothetical protein
MVFRVSVRRTPVPSNPDFLPEARWRTACRQILSEPIRSSVPKSQRWRLYHAFPRSGHVAFVSEIKDLRRRANKLRSARLKFVAQSRCHFFLPRGQYLWCAHATPRGWSRRTHGSKGRLRGTWADMETACAPMPPPASIRFYAVRFCGVVADKGGVPGGVGAGALTYGAPDRGRPASAFSKKRTRYAQPEHFC